MKLPRSGLTLTRAILPTAIILFAVALRLFFFVGHANVDPWDDTLYLRLARQTLDGTLSQSLADAIKGAEQGLAVSESAFVLRRGTYLPIALCQRIFGATERASALPSLLASLGTILLVYWIGYRLSGRSVATVGALLYAVVPIDVVYSTRILADAPQTFWASGAVALSIEASRGLHRRGVRLLLYAAGGLCIYFAFFTRINGLLIAPVVLLAALPVLRKHETRFEPFLVIVTLFVALGLDSFYYFVQTGDAWFALHLEQASAQAVFGADQEALYHLFPGLVVHSAFRTGVPHHFIKLLLGTIDHYGSVRLFTTFAPLGIVAVVLALFRRRLGLLVFWLLLVFVYNQYGFRSIAWNAEEGTLHYYLVAHRLRYLMMLLPALCLVLAHMLAQAVKWNRAAAAALALVLFAPALHAGIANHRFYRGSLNDVRQAARFLLDQEIPLVYTDLWGAEQIRFFSLGKLRAEALEYSTVLEPGSFVALGGSRGFDLSSEEVARTLHEPYHGVFLDPGSAPDTWKQMTTIEGPRRDERISDLVVFRVPGFH
jgi:4-amino-4-deoxy-L-arabinose transferase-like glycosyltransferase